MSDIQLIILLTLMAGGCMPLGGWLASKEHIRPRWLENELRHFVIALGGGILLGAVTLVLVPEGMAHMNESLAVFPVLLAGGLIFFLIERALCLKRREAPQLMGMLLDFVPEALALGGLLAVGGGSAPLLAFLIGLQNVPEGFNAYREIDALSHHKPARTMTFMVALLPLGPLAGIFGYYFLAGFPFALGAIMLFASGGMLYLMFQDIAPQARLHKHWAPPLGAVIGFSVALAGHMLTN